MLWDHYECTQHLGFLPISMIAVTCDKIDFPDKFHVLTEVILIYVDILCSSHCFSM